MNDERNILPTITELGDNRMLGAKNMVVVHLSAKYEDCCVKIPIKIKERVNVHCTAGNFYNLDTNEKIGKEFKRSIILKDGKFFLETPNIEWRPD